MTSISTLSSTVITIQFDLDRDIDADANDVQAAINVAAARPRPLRQRGSPCIVASTAKNSLLQKWLKTVDQTPQKESGYEGKRRNDTARSHGDPR
jgi:multidrug efflux pump subunit AcrB